MTTTTTQTNGNSASGSAPRPKIKSPQDVDTSLHPYPSGRAKQLADAHQTEHSLKLYGGWFCPFVQRIWMVLHEKRIPHQYIEINPYHKDPSFLALNPRGLVPTLAVPVCTSTGKELKPLYESVVVAEYLEEVYQDLQKYGARLLPEDAYKRARCRLWIDHVSSRIVPAFYRFIQHTEEKDYSLEEAREGWWKAVLGLMGEMEDAKAGPWFLGETFSLVDVMLAPWAMRLFLLDHYKKGGRGEPNDKDARWERWLVWYDAITRRESVKDTWSEDERYVEAYKRYAEDTTGSEVGQATRGGGRLP